MYVYDGRYSGVRVSDVVMVDGWAKLKHKCGSESIYNMHMPLYHLRTFTFVIRYQKKKDKKKRKGKSTKTKIKKSDGHTQKAYSSRHKNETE
mmetsp:Transcript_28150/g.71762  ORF Transcript_28150/g.71762 Transcript_28150/m.71762 type:complete len:92 (+) Transcript_28150:1185-1460(+)